jgi:hypothetical protein
MLLPSFAIPIFRPRLLVLADRAENDAKRMEKGIAKFQSVILSMLNAKRTMLSAVHIARSLSTPVRKILNEILHIFPG